MTKQKMDFIKTALEWGTKTMTQNVKAANNAGNVLIHTGGKKILPKSAQKAARKALSERVGDLGRVTRMSVSQKVKSALPGGARALRQEASPAHQS